MTAESLGWGPPGLTSAQRVRVRVPGMLDSPPFFPLLVRREVAPLFAELCRWLVAERARLALPPLSCSGGYNKRLIRGSTSKWSNHSWGLAGDFCVATNPMGRVLVTDMPPGTREKAESLGMRWGGTYTSRPDAMHFEVVVSPDEVGRIVACLNQPKARTAPDPVPAQPLLEEDDVSFIFNDGTKTYLRDGGATVHIPSATDLKQLTAVGIKNAGRLSEEMTKRLVEVSR